MKPQNNNILMICYYFPPLLDVGCKRSVAFAKYFDKHGWSVDVLSCKNPDKKYCLIGNEQPPNGVETHYSRSIINLFGIIGDIGEALTRVSKLLGIKLTKNFIYNLICIPDHFIGWIPLTVVKGLSLLKKKNHSIIYVSCSPWSASIIGIVLKIITRKPLILDFRDPFALDHTPMNKSYYSLRIKTNRLIENWFIKMTDVFIVNSNEVKDLYEKKYPTSRGKTFAIHNGFDKDFILDAPKIKFTKFTIIYIGEFYFFSPEYIDAFFDAIVELQNKGLISKDSFQFLFYGDNNARIKKIAEEKGIASLVSSNGRIPYSEVLAALSKSHLQLLRIVKYFISSKLFEGIPMNIPFLATIPSGEAEQIIRQYSLGSYVITAENKTKVADAIVDAMGKYKNDTFPQNEVDRFLNDFSRENLTTKLENIIQTQIFSVR